MTTLQRRSEGILEALPLVPNPPQMRGEGRMLKQMHRATPFHLLVLHNKTAFPCHDKAVLKETLAKPDWKNPDHLQHDSY